MTFREIDMKFMKSPYDTHCDDLPGNYTTGQEYSLDKVNEAISKRYQFVTPFRPIYNHSMQDRMMLDIHFRDNKTMRTEVNSLSQKYGNLKGCITKFVDTTAELLDERRPYVAVYWPQDEKLSVRYVPDQELIDYIVYIGSCIGVWFGLSVFSVNDGILFFINLKYKKNGFETHSNCVSGAAIRILTHRLNGMYELVNRSHSTQDDRNLLNDVKYLRRRMQLVENRLINLISQNNTNTK